MSDELIKCLSRDIHIALFQDTLDILMNNTEIDTRRQPILGKTSFPFWPLVRGLKRE